MAPLFYCRCSNCNCTATVLITKGMRSQQNKTQENELLKDKLEDSELLLEDTSSVDVLTPTNDSTGSDKLERTNTAVELFFIIAFFIIVLLGNIFVSYIHALTSTFSVLVRLILTIRTIHITISQGSIAKWNTSKVVGGLQIKISCQAGRAENHARGKRENFTDTVSLIFENDKKRAGQYQGWKGVRKAALMGHLL